MIAYKHKIWAGLALSILLLMACPMAVFASPGTTVSIPDASADPAGTVTVPINITEVTDLGAADIWLSYNKDVVIVDSVANGDLGVITFSIDNTAGVTKMNWFSATGETGDFVFAYVTLHAVGDPGDTSALDLDVKELVNTSAVPISHDVDDGLFTVTGVPLPPAVGGTAYLPDKLGILAPWIALLALAVIATATIGWLSLRRRRG